MEKKGGGVITLVLQVLGLLAILGVLGVSIAVLIKVNKQKPSVVIQNGTGNGQAAIGIPPPQPISSSDNNYQGYKNAAQLFAASVNTKADPCNDFYAYTCGNFKGEISFGVSDDSNFAKMAQQINKADYVATAPQPVKQLVMYYNQCVIAAKSNWTALTANGAQVTNAINRLAAGEAGLENRTQFPFPMFQQNKDVTTFPDPYGLGFLIGDLSGQEGVPTIVSTFEDTNWKNPHGTYGYSVYIDQPSTIYDNTYYVKAWDQIKAGFLNTVISTMNLYASTQGVTLNQTLLASDAASIVAFDYMLAMNFSTDDTTRRQNGRSYNPMTMKDLRTSYPAIEWHILIPEALSASDNATNRVLGDPSYQYIVMETQQLSKLLAALVPNNPYGITPRTLVNYFYYRLVAANSQYLPWPAQTYVSEFEQKFDVQWRQPSGKSKRRIRHDKRQKDRRLMDADSDIANSCAGETMYMLQYANARVFIDNIYNTPESRVAVRQQVSKLATSIVIGFRSMIDQIDWMTSSTKTGAYGKMDNLVKNIAYPDWITDDTQLTLYHMALDINSTDDYFAVVAKANKFNMLKQWEYITHGPADRTDFAGPPGTTNAWYQPELNSITFPAAILHQPFYDPAWPASVNFGSMGVVAGHELTHGFDDQGVQWDGTGVLNGWMDASSATSFKAMAGCVVNEYSNFCPLDKTKYGSSACIDGSQTQGENIADNGGIHSAFRAYRNYINLNGPDPLLPDPTMQQFTADQLFFMAFAQTWCQLPPSPAAEQRQILVDVHSPSQYRVWGTIQNFPAFKNAFNCPTDSKYAPVQHCNVWVSDFNGTYGLPPTQPPPVTMPPVVTTSPPVTFTTAPTVATTPPSTPPSTAPTAPSAATAACTAPTAAPTKTPSNGSPIGVANPPVIQPTDPNYQGYMSVVNLFKSAINTSVDPCNDFYAYTCGNFNGEMSFDVSDDGNFALMAQQINNKPYVQSSPYPVKQLVMYYTQCVIAANENWNQLVADGAQVKNALARLAAGEPGFPAQTQFPFPMYDQKSDVTTFPGPEGLGWLIGYLGGFEGVSTLVSAYADTNWKNPHGTSGYSFYIDQPSTEYDNTYYIKAWNTTSVKFFNNIINNMNAYAKTQGTTLDQTMLQNDANAIVAFDYLLAMAFSTDDTTRRQNARNYNPMTMAQLMATFPQISWSTFTQQSVGTEADAAKVLLDPNYEYVVMEPAKLTALLAAMAPGNAYGITPRTVINYFYYRLVDANSQYLPQATGNKFEVFLNKGSVKWRQAGPSEKRRIIHDKRGKRIVKDADDDIASACAGETMGMLMYANARVFIDKIYPTQASRVAIRQEVSKVATSIVIGFRSMIDQIAWMTPGTKKGAYSKIDNLVKNIAYPDWITDNTQLTNYHAALDISPADDYFVVIAKANKFNYYKQWEYLTHGSADRQDFAGPPGTTNAWYQDELNSITFPAAILRQPFYDPRWPASINFGAMGVIAGHELTHGFDDQGVQWDGTGVLSGWMDDQSNVAFKNMASCVVNEYSNFCPINQTIYGASACIDGSQTQGENIADNGGIHSAFRAYRNYINLNGPDPQLPDDIMQYFSADQLFFMAFAQVWCQLPPSDAADQHQILVDVHSPSKYRVWGTLQNFPAFKTAFNCPANSNYAPAKHCDVWVSDFNGTYGTPVVKSELNIPDTPLITTANVDQYNAYQQAINFFKPAVNFSADPCNDFYTYACGNYDQLVSFHQADAANLVSMAQQLTNPSYQPTIQSSTALTKEKSLFDNCVSASLNNSVAGNQLLQQNNYIMTQVNTLATALGSNFTVGFGGVAKLPTATQLATALGYLSFQQAIDTYITPLVDTNWIDPTKGYRMFIDQNTAARPKTYYLPTAYNTTRQAYIKSIYSNVAAFLTQQKVTFDSDALFTAVSRLADFEQMIANTYSTDDTTRRQFKRSWNLKNSADMMAAYPFIDWPTYMKMVPGAAAAAIVADPNYQVSVMEMAMIGSFSADYLANKFDPSDIVNYLFIRLIMGNSGFIVPSGNVEIEEPEFHLGKSRRPSISKAKRVSGDDLSDTQNGCADVANNLMQFANGRVFIDFLYPNQAAKDNIRATAGGVISNVINAFQGMIDQLDWMVPNTKLLAYGKTVQIDQNVAYPDWITDNTQLDAYYSTLVFAAGDNYYDMTMKLTVFNLWLQYNQLTKATYDRHDFLGQPGTVNAWYQPELNSITFPAGILRPPYFHPLWPASINYGGMGLVAGHELTHGFDDQGVQWDPIGALNSWMDTNSTVGFQNMANCVINEYSNFCPLAGTQYVPSCVNGQQTQGENIADNGGIHAAFRAYRNHVQLNGPDPLLPDRIFGQFTHDQLFFLNFGQVWCEKERTQDRQYTQIMTDPHSPSKYRVFGTIQNYPAFQTAYNCPLGSAYAPKQHCEVWVPTKSP